MRRFRLLACLFAFLTLACVESSAQPTFLRDKIDSAKQAVRGVASYPPETRLAILEMSQRPKLILEMANTGKLPVSLVREPESIQDAAKELIQYPDVLKTLRDHIELVAIVGRFYSDSPTQARGIAEKLAAEADKEEQEQQEKWAELLEKNQSAMEEFAEAIKELIEAEESDEEDTEEQTDEGYSTGVGSCASVEGDSLNVYAGPTGEVVDYLLANADQYANAAAAALQYCQAYPTGQLAQEAVSDLAGRASVAEMVANPGFLRDWANSRKESSQRKERPASRRDGVQGPATPFGRPPSLGKGTGPFGGRGPLGNAIRRQKTPLDTGRAGGQRPQPMTSRKPSRRGSSQLPKSVRKGKSSKPQRVSRANSRHRSSWKGMPGGRSAAGGRPGGSGGGPRRGPGR